MLLPAQPITARGLATRSRRRFTRRVAISRVEGSSSPASAPDQVNAWVTVPPGVCASRQLPFSVKPRIRSIGFELFGHLNNVIHDYEAYFNYQMSGIALNLGLKESQGRSFNKAVPGLG